MRPVLKLYLLLLVSVVLTACLSATPKPPLPLKPCQMFDNVAAECGTLGVYENRAAQSGRTIALNIAVLRAKSSTIQPDPLFFITGGPGAAATESYTYYVQTFAPINEQRDIVVVDQRGTGGSHPLLCPPVDVTTELSKMNVFALADLIVSCLEQLDGDLRFYTTPIAMDDLDDVRAALGYDQINLYGVSYGAIAAQVYLRQHEDHVRTVILDSGSLLNVRVFELSPRSAQHALDLMFDRCETDPACHTAFPNVRAEFKAVLDRLDHNPTNVELVDPKTSKPLNFEFTHDQLAETILRMNYSAKATALLPQMIHRAQTSGDFKPLATQFLSVVIDPTLVLSQAAMRFTILCSEAWAASSPDEITRLGGDSYYVENALRSSRALRARCSVWPKAELPADYTNAVRSQKPVLLLNGEADPVNPPDNVANAVETLPNSRTVVVPGLGHGVITFGCLPSIAAEFINEGSAKELNTDCVKDIPLPPFNTQQ